MRDVSQPPGSPLPVPTKATEDQRRHPRIDLLVQVQVSHDAEVHILSTVNISRGGVFLAGDPLDYPELTEGATVELSIFAAEDLGVADAHLRARVLRLVPPGQGPQPGFALEFLPARPAESQALEGLLAARRT